MKSDFKNIEFIFFGLLALWFFFLRPIFSKKKESSKSKTPSQMQRAPSWEPSPQEPMAQELPEPPEPPLLSVPSLSREKVSLEKRPLKKSKQKKLLSPEKLREAIILSEILKKPY